MMSCLYLAFQLKPKYKGVEVIPGAEWRVRHISQLLIQCRFGIVDSQTPEMWEMHPTYISAMTIQGVNAKLFGQLCSGVQRMI